MEIEDAFTQEAISTTDTNVEGEDEARVRKMIRAVYESNQLELSDDHENISVLMFVAGRAYQEGNSGIQIEMSRQELVEYSRYLIATRRADMS